VVVLYASIYNDVPMVVNISGRFDLKKELDILLMSDDWLLYGADASVLSSARTPHHILLF
jgi:hypothetical protein